MSQVAEAGSDVAAPESNAGVISLPSHFQISEVEEVCSDLRAALDQGSLTIDCSEVEAIDTAGVQLLYAVAKKAAEAGVEINWKGEVEPIKEAAELLGLSGELGF